MTVLGKKTIGVALLQGVDYAFPILVAPILIHQLGLDRFGIFVFAFAASAFLTVMVEWGFGWTAVRELVAKERSFAQQVLLEVVSARLMIAAVGCVGLTFISHNIPQVAPYRSGIILVYIQVLSFALNMAWYLNARGGMMRATMIVALARIVQFCVALLLVNSELSNEVISLLLFSPLLMANGVLVLLELRGCHPPTLFQLIGQALARMKSGSSGTVLAVGSGLYRSANPIIVSIFCASADVGAYGAIEKVVKALQDLARPLLTALYPIAASEAKRDPAAARRLLYRCCVGMVFVGIVIILIINTFSEKLLNLIGGRELVKYSFLLGFMCVGPLFGLVNNILGPQYHAIFGIESKIAYHVLIIGLISSVATGFACATWGVVGAAYCFVLAEFFLFFVLVFRHCSIRNIFR